MRVNNQLKSIIFVMLFMFSLNGFSEIQDNHSSDNIEVVIYVDSPRTIVVRKNVSESEGEPIIIDYIKNEEEDILVVAEIMPQFIGGEQAMYTFLNKNVYYTQCAKDSMIQGRVYVQFVVEKDGSITNVTVPRGLYCGLNEVAIKAVKKMPKWIPGEQRGKKVRVKYTLPIQFKFQ
jgi:TonB family protein